MRSGGRAPPQASERSYSAFAMRTPSVLCGSPRYRRSMRNQHPKLLDRRQALGALGVLGVGAVAAACSSTKTSPQAASTSASTSTRPRRARPPASASSASGAAACTLTPEATEGPFYLDINDVRQDITEGKAGTPLALTINVVDASACSAIKDAAVDIWHCDAGGEYSGVQGSAARRSCAARNSRTRTGPRRSTPSTRAGTRAGPCTST